MAATIGRRRVVLAGALPWASALAFAQPASSRKPARVGWLGWTGDTAAAPAAALEAVRSGLAERGWKEGDKLLLVQRSAGREQAAAMAAEIMRENVDLIVVQGLLGFLVRGQTGATPLVLAINGDPVEAGLTASLARPGGLLTGVTTLSTELSAKRIELLKDARPGLARVALLANDRRPGLGVEQAATWAAAEKLGLTLKYFPVAGPQDFDAAFAAIARETFSGLVAFPDTLINAQAAVIAAFTRSQRLPAISGWAEFAQAGNLMSYGPNYRDFYGLLARHVDQLLRGARPGDLAVEQPTKFELVINQTAARGIGLVLPQALLQRADEVIR